VCSMEEVGVERDRMCVWSAIGTIAKLILATEPKL
jgi:hypothetical protein